MGGRLPPEVLEQKYVFLPTQKAFLLSWLDRSLVWDPRYPSGTVSSIYYDTPDLRFYQETRYGFYQRTKVRVRWYDDAEDAPPSEEVTCYLEVKRKRGKLRSKERQAVPLEARRLVDDPFTDATIVNFGRQFQEAVFEPGQIFVPVALVRYQRHRFFDPATGSRVSLDSGIRCPRRNAVYLPSFGSTAISTDIIEIKGQSDVFPDALRPIVPLLSDDSFSKYARCCEQILQPMRSALVA